MRSIFLFFALILAGVLAQDDATSSSSSSEEPMVDPVPAPEPAPWDNTVPVPSKEEDRTMYGPFESSKTIRFVVKPVWMDDSKHKRVDFSHQVYYFPEDDSSSMSTESTEAPKEAGWVLGRCVTHGPKGYETKRCSFEMALNEALLTFQGIYDDNSKENYFPMTGSVGSEKYLGLQGFLKGTKEAGPLEGSYYMYWTIYRTAHSDVSFPTEFKAPKPIHRHYDTNVGDIDDDDDDDDIDDDELDDFGAGVVFGGILGALFGVCMGFCGYKRWMKKREILEANNQGGRIIMMSQGVAGGAAAVHHTTQHVRMDTSNDKQVPLASFQQV